MIKPGGVVAMVPSNLRIASRVSMRRNPGSRVQTMTRSDENIGSNVPFTCQENNERSLILELRKNQPA
jgi:hypothetical protein